MPAPRVASDAAAAVAVPQKQPEVESMTASFMQAPVLVVQQQRLRLRL